MPAAVCARAKSAWTRTQEPRSPATTIRPIPRPALFPLASGGSLATVAEVSSQTSGRNNKVMIQQRPGPRLGWTRFMTKYDKIKFFIFALLSRGKSPLTQGVLLKSPMPQREGGSSLFKRETEQLCSKQPRRRIGGGKVCQPRCDGDTKRAQIISEETPTSPGFTVAGHQLAMRVAKERASPLCRPIVRVSSAG